MVEWYTLRYHGCMKNGHRTDSGTSGYLRSGPAIDEPDEQTGMMTDWHYGQSCPLALSCFPCLQGSQYFFSESTRTPRCSV